MKSVEECIQEARNLYAYQVSGKYDENEEGNTFDLIWCSLYDICRLFKDGIIEDINQEDFDETYTFLNDTKVYTKNYKEKEFEF